MSGKPRVSILSPVFNEEDHILEMLDSVRAQSLTQWELFLVDDGSTDKTVAIAAVQAKMDSRIKIVSGMGKIGKTRAFNEAFARCTGDNIVLLAGDDILPTESLSKRLKLIEQAETNKVCGYSRLITMSDDESQNGIIIPKSRKGGRSGGTLVMSRSLAAEVFPIPEDLIAEDIWLAEMVALKGEQIVENDEVVLKYRIHQGNSNPRSKPFAEMSLEIHKRQLPLQRVLELVDNLGEEYKQRLLARISLEEMRYNANLWGIMTAKNVTLTERLRAASMANEKLFRLRNRFFKIFSGWS